MICTDSFVHTERRCAAGQMAWSLLSYQQSADCADLTMAACVSYGFVNPQRAL